MVINSDPTLNKYLQLRSTFTDFEYFQGNPSQRADEKRRFLSETDYTPRYTYPNLKDLSFDENVTHLKSSLLEASFGLSAVERSPEVGLQVQYIHSELARIALVEAARNMLIVNSSDGYRTSSEAFNRRNVEAYGELDYDLSLSMMGTELKNALSVAPTDVYKSTIAFELVNLLGSVERTDVDEPELLSDYELKTLQQFVLKKYSEALILVPDTGDDTYYDAAECKAVLDAVLKGDGLLEKGWRVVINDESIVVSTYPNRRTVYIPADISYTADEIRRILIGHEIKAHAWRYENSLLANNQILEEGTASSADIEEGLGILIECAISGNLNNPSLDRARDRYITAGLALGADGIKRDAREVYEVLWRILVLRGQNETLFPEDKEIKAKQAAFAHVENAFRGTSFTRKGVIYTKLKIYYEGLVKNAQFFKERIHDLDSAFDIAFLGRYDHTSEAERKLFIEV